VRRHFIKSLQLCCLGLLLTSTTLLRAQRLEITPFYGYRFGGEVEDPYSGEKLAFDAAPAYGLFLDAGPKNSEVRVELLWSRQDSSFNISGDRVDLTIDQIQIGGVTEFSQNRLREYVSVLAGATHYSTADSGSDTQFSLSFGVGAKYLLLRHVALRADLRGYCTVVDSQGGFIQPP
jgi:hypothetical protein